MLKILPNFSSRAENFQIFINFSGGKENMIGLDQNGAIVISGIGGRFPKSRNVAEFWTNLLSGQELFTEDDSRWPVGKWCACARVLNHTICYFYDETVP